MIKKKLIFILIAIILCAIIIPLFLIFGGKQDKSILENEKTGNGTPQAQFEEVNFTLYNDKKTARWELTARKLVHEEKNDYIKLNPVEISVYDNETDKVLYRFRSEKANYNGSKEELKISGPVVVKFANFQLKAGNLSWQQKEDLIKAYSGVEIKTLDGEIISGEKLHTNSCFSTISIYGSNEKQASWSGGVKK